MLESSMNGGNLAWPHTLQSTESSLVNMDARLVLLSHRQIRSSNRVRTFRLAVFLLSVTVVLLRCFYW